MARDRQHSRAKSFCCSVGCGAARTLRGGAKTIYESTALRNAGGRDPEEARNLVPAEPHSWHRAERGVGVSGSRPADRARWNDRTASAESALSFGAQQGS